MSSVLSKLQQALFDAHSSADPETDISGLDDLHADLRRLIQSHMQDVLQLTGSLSEPLQFLATDNAYEPEIAQESISDVHIRHRSDLIGVSLMLVPKPTTQTELSWIYAIICHRRKNHWSHTVHPALERLVAVNERNVDQVIRCVQQAAQSEGIVCPSCTGATFN
eukprot:NODE_830_length_1164_cov_3.005786_g788_i0.p1 GENE.NODE_830_length_1164_cov_3.005786_g788_i0~~NODE_830_length_1164_cov_3.005786_g788_i0.p1  ORF type:complete len:185 (+),score=36.67 NODE_830_length_1164_cov_3.005786_g788_i0:61-555(+)